MKNTLIVTSQNRAIDHRVELALTECRVQGAGHLRQTGTADVTLARCVALTMAAEAATSARGQHFDVLVMIDDDMAFQASQVQELASHVRKTGRAAAGLYVTSLGRPACAPLEGSGGRFMTGLGFVGFTIAQLLQLREESPRFEFNAGQQAAHEFTWSRPVQGIWHPEDFVLCRRLGGVELLPIEVGHLKLVPLLPNEKTTAQVAGWRGSHV